MITNNVKAGTKQVVQKQKEEHSALEEKIKKGDMKTLFMRKVIELCLFK